MATTTTTRKFDENGNPDGTTIVTTQDPVKDNEAFEEAEKKRLEAQQAQMRTDAAQNWEQYKTNFNAANNENTAGLAAAGRTVMDRAFIVHNAIQGVKSGELYGGDPKMGRRFVMNAVLGFGDAVAKARGIQLVSGDDNGSMKTGFDGKNFNLVFRTGSGQYVSKAVSPEQFSQQLVAKGYLDADWNKPKEDAGKGSSAKPEKPAAEPKPTDWSAHYNRFFENDVGEDGKALASGSRHLTPEGYANLELDLETATGDQKDYIARTLANADAKEAEKAWKKEHDGEDNLDQSQNPYKSTFLASYAKYNPKQEEGGQAGATPPPSAPNPEGPDDPLAAAFGMDEKYADKFNEAQQARTTRLNRAAGNRSVYVPGTNGNPGHWRTAAELAGSGYDEKTGKFKTEEQRLAELDDYSDRNMESIEDANEKKRIAQEMTSQNYIKNGLKEAPKPEEQKKKYEFNQDEFDDQWLKARGFASWDDAQKELTDADMRDYRADVEREKYEAQFGSPEERAQKKEELRQRRIDRYATDMARAWEANRHNDRKAVVEDLVAPYVGRDLSDEEKAGYQDSLSTEDVRNLYKTAFIKNKDERRGAVNAILADAEDRMKKADEQAVAFGNRQQSWQDGPHEPTPDNHPDAQPEVQSGQTPDGEPPASEQEPKQSAADADETDKIERDAIRDNAIKSVDSFFTRARGAGQNPDTPDERRAKIKSAFQGAKTVLNDNLEDYGNGNVRVANSWRGERKAALSALFGAVGAKKTGGKFVMTRKQYEMAVDLLDNWIESMD